MAEQASAYVTLIPSAKGFGAGTERALAGELPQVGDRQGKALGGRLSGAFGGVLKKSVIGISAAAGAAIGTTLFKGFRRLDAIDQAKAKLSGLGHSAAEVGKIMDSALASVKGTAFGLDEAATVAASAVAAGVKPGQQLQRTLSLVADAATIGGTSMAEMGAIFNKVATSNKVQGDVINQLNDAGIPIVQLLGKSLGKTSEQVLQLSRDGKIGFADFQKAIQTGMGGAALKSGNTFTGALKNVGAAAGRLGAAFLGPAFTKGPNLFGKITSSLDAAGPAATRLGAAVGAAFGTVGRLVAPVAKAIGGLFSGLQGSTQMTQFLTTVKSVFTSVKSIVMDAVSIMQSLWARFGGTITTLAKSAFGSILQIIRGAFTIIQGIFKVFSSLLKGDWKGVWDGIKLILKGAWTAIKGIVSLGWAAIKAIFKAAGTAIKGIFVGLWNGLKSAAVAGGTAIKNAFRDAINWVIDKWNALTFTIGEYDFLGVHHEGLTVNTPNIPRLADGGIVSRPTLALIGESGREAVVPLDKGRSPLAPSSPVRLIGELRLVDGKAYVEGIIQEQAFAAGVA